MPVKMDMTVAVVDDAFLNEERMDHSAALMCFSPGSTYEGAKVDLSLMPVGRFSLYPKPEGRHFFINKDWRIFGRIYRDMNDKDMKVIALRIEENSYADMHSEDVLDSLAKFVDSLALKQKLVITETIEELEQFFKSLKNKKLEDILQSQLSQFNGEFDPATRMYLQISSWYGDYFRSYAYFLKAHPSMSEGEYKQFIRELENLPKFGMETLKWGSYRSVYRLVADFLKYHICENIDCGGFSLRKCSKCKSAHFCDVECQKKAFPYHKNMCQFLKKFREYKREVPWTLKSYVDEGLHDDTDDDVVTFEVFLRELMMKAYSSFHETLRKGDESIHTTMIYVLIRSKRYSQYSHLKLDYKKMGMLLGNDQTAGCFDSICKQMLEFPGKEDVEFEKEEILFKDDMLHGRVRFWMMMIALQIPKFGKEAEVILSKWGVETFTQEDVDEMKASGTQFLHVPPPPSPDTYM